MRTRKPLDEAIRWDLPPSLVWLLRRPHLALFVGFAVAIVVELTRGRSSIALTIQLLAIAAFAAGAVSLFLFLLTGVSRRR